MIIIITKIDSNSGIRVGLSISRGRKMNDHQERIICFFISLLIIVTAIPLLNEYGSEKSLPIPPSRGDIINVDQGGSGDYTRIQDAIDNSTIGDIIQLDIPINGENYYISPFGSTFENLTEALDHCSGGETLIIGNGTYDDRVIITVSNLTIIGNSTSNCLFTNNRSFTSNINVSANNFTIMNIGFLTSNHNTTSIRFGGNDLNISHCYFNGTGYFISQVNLSSYSRRIDIYDCEFHQDGYYCKSVYDNSVYGDIHISHCFFDVYGLFSSGYFVKNSSMIIIKKNVFRIETYLTTSTESYNYKLYGVYFKEGRNIIIDDNNFIGLNWRRAVPYGIHSDFNIQSKNNNYNYKILNISISNCIFNMKRYGFGSVLISYCSKVYIYNNKINDKTGFRVYFSKLININNNTEGKYQAFYSKNIIMNKNFLINSTDGLVGTGENISIFNNNAYLILANGNDICIHNNTFLRQGIEARGQNISIQNNTLHFSAGHTGNVQGAIRVEGSTSSAEPIFSNSNITINNNVINGKGDLVFTETVVDGFGCAGVYLTDINGLTMVNNIIRSNGRTAKGCLFTHVANTNIQNNSIKVQGNFSVGVNIGIHVRWGNRINYGLTMYNNEIVMEGNGTTAFRFQQRVYANDLYDNRVIINGGYGQKVVAAKDDVTQSISFSEVIMNNTQGLEAELSEDSKLTVIGAPITNATVSSDSKLDLYQSLEVGAVDVYGHKLEYADIKVLNDGDEYSTPGYGGDEPYPGEEGFIGPFIVHDRIFDGKNSADIFDTNISAKYEGDVSWEESVSINIHENTRYIFEVPDLNQPSIPKGLTGIPIVGTQNILLEWEPLPKDCLNYQLEYRIGGSWQALGTVPHPDKSFVHLDLDQDTTVQYQIRAYNGHLYSDWSKIITVVSGDITPPSQAKGLNITLVGYNWIGISWNPSLDLDVVNVSIQAREKGTGTIRNETVIDSSESSAIIGGLEPEHNYEMVVRFIDDAGLFSMSSVLDARTDFMRGKLIVQITFAEGSIWEGYGSSLKVTLTGVNHTQPSAKTDQFGTCTFEGLHIPDTISVTVDPPKGHEGTLGKIEGYIRVVSNNIHFHEDNQTEEIDLVMEYYSRGSIEKTGMISGKVSYPDEGKMNGQNVPNSVVEILFLNGTMFNTTKTNVDGYFEFTDLPLPFNCRIMAYPREEDGESYLENGSEILSISEDLFQVTVGIVLLYNPPDVAPEYVEIRGYGPTGEITDKKTKIFVEFSAPIKTKDLTDLILISPSPDIVRIDISSDKKTITIDHSGFLMETSYNVTVSFLIEFEGVLGLNQSLEWSFKVVNKDDGGNPDNGENDFNFFPILVILMVIILVAAGVFFYLRKNRNSSEKPVINNESEPSDYNED